jgi:hypothetical protein
MVLGLAVATIWFVALPMLNQPAQAKRTCEVFVLESGNTRCVTNAKIGATLRRTIPAKRVQQ